MQKKDVLNLLHAIHPRIHCLTNPVTMQDVANILLAADGSAVMARDPDEVEEISSICQGTLLNTGVPDEKIIRACILAGKKANQLGHPVILDPVGAGASAFRRKLLADLLESVQPSIVRCNQEEAAVLYSMKAGGFSVTDHAGVESALRLPPEDLRSLAASVSELYHCTFLITGSSDVVSDGRLTLFLTGGDARIRRITGGGCMLSALCALFAGTGIEPFDAALIAGQIWRDSAQTAGIRTDKNSQGIGSFHVYLTDALEEQIFERS